MSRFLDSWRKIKLKRQFLKTELQVCQAGNPVLRRVAKHVNPSMITSPEYQELTDRMVDIMRKQLGVGIAAPQVGVGLRIFCMEFTANHMTIMGPERTKQREMTILPLTILANPSLKVTGKGERATFEEGCLSVNGFVALVPRAKQVMLTGMNREGKEEQFLLNGWLARIAQHEMDHLDGVLYVDKMVDKSLRHIAAENHVGLDKDIERYETKLSL